MTSWQRSERLKSRARYYKEIDEAQDVDEKRWTSREHEPKPVLIFLTE